MGGTSRISREAYVRFCERLGVKFPGPTRLVAGSGFQRRYGRSEPTQHLRPFRILRQGSTESTPRPDESALSEKLPRKRAAIERSPGRGYLDNPNLSALLRIPSPRLLQAARPFFEACLSG